MELTARTTASCYYVPALCSGWSVQAGERAQLSLCILLSLEIVLDLASYYYHYSWFGFFQNLEPDPDQSVPNKHDQEIS